MALAIGLTGAVGLSGVIGGAGVGGQMAEAAPKFELSEAIAQTPQLGVRSIGMAGAYSALVPLVPAGLVNPAGLTALEARGGTFAVGIPLETDETTVMLAYGEPDRGVGGGLFSWAHNPVLLYPSVTGGVDEHLVRTRFSYAFGRRVNVGVGGDASQRPALLGLDGSDSVAGPLTPDTLAYGLELHYDHLVNESTDASAAVWGVGLGVMYQYSERLRLGLHLPSAYETPIEWSPSSGAPSESVGRRPALGLAFQADPTTVLALDWAPESASVLGKMRGGVESWVREDLALRVGGQLDQGTGDRTWSAGLSWHPHPRSLSLDVAYRQKQLFVSTSYTF